MTDSQRDELLTEAQLAIRKLQIAYPAAYNEAEAVFAAISALRERLVTLRNDPYYSSHRTQR